MTSHSDGVATDNDRAAVVGTVATVVDSVGDGAIAADTVTNRDDATIVNSGKKVSSSCRQDAGIQTQGQQDKSKWGRGRRMSVATA